MIDLLALPWLELAVVVPMLGALVVARLRARDRMAPEGIAFTALGFACALLAAVAYADGVPTADRWDIQRQVFGSRVLTLDPVNAPLVPTVALLYLLTAVTIGRRSVRRFSFPWTLSALGLHVAAFGCTDPQVLVGLVVVASALPVLELLYHERPVRVYLLHMALSVGLLVAGWAMVEAGSTWGVPVLLAGVLIRSGVFPAHCWVTDWFEHATFGRALLFVAPLIGVYAALRLVVPVAPDWALKAIGLSALVTAVYAAGMATIQGEARRFFAFLFLSHASLVLVGLELDNKTSLTGSLRLWPSVVLSIGGLGLTLRALEARVGRLSLTRSHGLYDQSPALAVCFLLSGLASVGFPGTAGFVAAELMVNGADEVSPWVGVGVTVAAALNGIAVVRAYFLVFAGARHGASIPLGINWKERLAVLTLAALLIGAGLAPQSGAESGHRAAEHVLKDRAARQAAPDRASR